MSTVLAIDTSAGTQVALVDGGATWAADGRVDPRGHAEYLTPMVRRVLSAAGRSPRDLTAVAVGIGPAPFTGLRVGIMTARSLARTVGIPVYGVASTEAWAASAFVADPDIHVTRVVTDARRREVYTARYRRTDDAVGLVCEDEPQVLTPGELAETVAAEREAGVAVVGPGLYPDLLGEVAPTRFGVSALARIALARAEAGQEVGTEPLYLRLPDIHGVPGGAA